MLKVKEYSSFEAFEQDEHRQDVDLVAIVNKPNGMVCADLITDCKMWQTAVNRFFKALAGDERFDGWQETITECIKGGFWQDKALTERVARAAALFDIRLTDHIIIAREGEFSFRRASML